MPLETTPWDVTDHLDSEEAVLEYLKAALEDGHPALIAAAINDVARARGLGDPGLSEATSIGLIVQVVKSLGLELTARAA